MHGAKARRRSALALLVSAHDAPLPLLRPYVVCSFKMGRQNEELRDPEKEWLEGVFYRGDVQAALASKSPSILKDAAKCVFPDYQVAFQGPLAEESEESFQRRNKNAKGPRKAMIHRRPAEKPEEVEGRMATRLDVCEFALPPYLQLTVYTGNQGMDEEEAS